MSPAPMPYISLPQDSVLCSIVSLELIRNVGDTCVGGLLEAFAIGMLIAFATYIGKRKPLVALVIGALGYELCALGSALLNDLLSQRPPAEAWAGFVALALLPTAFVSSTFGTMNAIVFIWLRRVRRGKP